MPASDIRVQKFPVQMDKKRNLCYDMNAFAEIEEKFGSVQEGLEQLSKQQFKAVRFLLWVGLIHEDETLTERQVGAMFSLDTLSDVINVMMDAIIAALPKQTDDGGKAKNK